jgi:hypothetical protein
MGETPKLQMQDAAEMLWVVLANVSGGDWSKQTPEWQEAAARWRDHYFAVLSSDGDACAARRFGGSHFLRFRRA